MKNSDNYKVIGMMSGTSMDGLDIAYCEFAEQDNHWSWRVMSAETIPYPTPWIERLKQAMTMSGEELSLLHVDLGRYLGECLAEFIEKNDCTPQLIGSHGHTIFHQPDKKLTLQIGAGSEIHARCGVPVACDFRTLDLALNGQGAPLVPIGDELLFQSFDACLNLGGIANISFQREGKRVAFDISPCNMTLNWLAQKVGKAYDADGALAASGHVNDQVLDQLNTLPYYLEPFPKSLGFEDVEENIFPLLQNGSIPDMLRTSVIHTAHQIAQTFDAMEVGQPRILVTGGGVFNSYLMKELSERLQGKGELIVPERLTVEYKEAMVFAFLGLLRKLGRINVLASVTGASQDSSSGVIYG